MKKFLIIIAVLLQACNNGNDNENNQDDELATCLGFNSPAIFVTVSDSLNDISLSSSKVYVYYIDSIQSAPEAIYDESTSSYFTYLEGWNGETIGLVVSDDNYHTAVVKNIEFTLDTSCGAENEIMYSVHLCPLGSACL